jgi:integrase
VAPLTSTSSSASWRPPNRWTQRDTPLGRLRGPRSSAPYETTLDWNGRPSRSDSAWHRRPPSTSTAAASKTLPSVVGPRRAIIATLGLAGPRVTELCMLDNQDVDLTKARFFVQDAKTAAGVRDVDIHGRLLSELQLHRAQLGAREIEAPAFPTRAGTRREKDNMRAMSSPRSSSAPTSSVSAASNPPSTSTSCPTPSGARITYMLAAGHHILTSNPKSATKTHDGPQDLSPAHRSP